MNALRKHWIWSTEIFVLQIIVGGAVLYFTDGSVTTLAAFSIAIFAAGAAALSFAAFAAAFAALSIAIFAAGAVGVGIVFGAVTLAATIVSSAFAVEEARKNGDIVPTWALVAVVMPIGIGTIVGGLLLIYYRLDRKEQWNGVSNQENPVP